MPIQTPAISCLLYVGAISRVIEANIDRRKYLEETRDMRAVIVGAPASCVAPDVPTPDVEYGDTDALSGLIKNVSEEWCWHIPDKSTLALFLPYDHLPATLSREHFVELLEYCEDELNVKRVLVCFNKNNIDPRHGIPRALNCIGFTVLPPEKFPPSISPSSIFAMVYNI